MTENERELLLFLAKRWEERNLDSGWYGYVHNLRTAVEAEPAELDQAEEDLRNYYASNNPF